MVVLSAAHVERTMTSSQISRGTASPMQLMCKQRHYTLMPPCQRRSAPQPGPQWLLPRVHPPASRVHVVDPLSAPAWRPGTVCW